MFYLRTQKEGVKGLRVYLYSRLESLSPFPALVILLFTVIFSALGNTCFLSEECYSEVFRIIWDRCYTLHKTLLKSCF